MNEFQDHLIQRLNDTPDQETLVRWICEEVLKSYKNGIKAGRKGETVKRQGKSRGSGSYGEAA